MCAPGGSYEMEFPKDAHTKPPKEFQCSFGGLYLFWDEVEFGIK
jgi:hypothetical protein